jgi:hypothetical protein
LLAADAGASDDDLERAVHIRTVEHAPSTPRFRTCITQLRHWRSFTTRAQEDIDWLRRLLGFGGDTSLDPWDCDLSNFLDRFRLAIITGRVASCTYPAASTIHNGRYALAEFGRLEVKT